jgi:hypothetical protein
MPSVLIQDFKSLIRINAMIKWKYIKREVGHPAVQLVTVRPCSISIGIIGLILNKRNDNADLLVSNGDQSRLR